MKRLLQIIGLLCVLALPLHAQNVSGTLSSTGVACPVSPGLISTSASAISIQITGPTGSVAFSLAGSAGTVSFYTSANAGKSWQPLNVTASTGGGAITSTTAAGDYNNTAVGAFTNFCALLASSTGGSVAVTIQLSLAGGSSGGGSGGGSASYYQTAQQSTVPLTQRNAYNFIAPMVVSDDASNGSSDVTCSNCLNVNNNAQNANQLISGGAVEWTGNYNFTVGAATYSISGMIYSSPLTNVTLAAADPSNPRIDVIEVDNTGTVHVLTGTPSATPIPPSVDPTTQLELTFIYVGANTTSPTNITRNDIYHSNTEWNTVRSPATAVWTLASTNNPYDTTVDIEATNVALNNFVTLTDPAAATVDLGTLNALVFYVRSKATWNAARSLSLQWYNGATAKGQIVVLRSGTFGFSSSNITSYQQISIPTSLFGIAGVPVTTLRFTVSGTGATTIGFYLDDITLQGGTANTTLPTGVMVFRGAWSSSVAYNQYDVVSYSGTVYIASQAGTNNTPSAMSAFWTPTGGSGGSPGGSTTQIQYNLASAFAGIPGSVVDTTGQVTLAPADPVDTQDAGLVVNSTATLANPLDSIRATATATDNSGLEVFASGGIFQSELLGSNVAGDGGYGVRAAVINDSSGGIPIELSGFVALPLENFGTAAPTQTGMHIQDQASSTQASGTNAALLIDDQTAGGTVFAIKTGLGLVSFGDRTHITLFNSVEYALIVNANNGAGPSAPINFNAFATDDTGTGYTSQGLYSTGQINGMNVTGDSMYAAEVIADNVGASGTAAELTGLLVDSNVSNMGTNAVIQSGIHIQDQGQGSQPTSVGAGILIDDQTVGSTIFAIKTGKGPVMFGDIVENGSVAFGSLGTPPDGTQIYCSTCDTPGSPGASCASAGDMAGAMAWRIRGAWKCW